MSWILSLLRLFQGWGARTFLGLVTVIYLNYQHTYFSFQGQNRFGGSQWPFDQRAHRGGNPKKECKGHLTSPKDPKVRNTSCWLFRARRRAWTHPQIKKENCYGKICRLNRFYVRRKDPLRPKQVKEEEEEKEKREKGKEKKTHKRKGKRTNYKNKRRKEGRKGWQCGWGAFLRFSTYERSTAGRSWAAAGKRGVDSMDGGHGSRHPLRSV